MTEVSNEMSPSQPPVDNQSLTSINPPNQSKRLMIIFGVILLLLIGGSTYFLTARKSQPVTQYEQPTLPVATIIEPSVTNQTSPEAKTSPSSSAAANVNLRTGFAFYLPKDWTAKISDQSKQHFYGKFFLPSLNKELSYIEIESITAPNSTKNPFIRAEKTQQKIINGLNATIVEGRENFQSSNRLVKQATFTNGSYALVITMYRRPADNIDAQFDAFIQSVSASGKTSGKRLFFISEVFAAEVIAGVDKEKYVRVEVMGDPLPERITKKDAQYKDGYAKFYKFEAFRGQRLTAVAMEDQTTNPGSFIRSELYDEQGKLLDGKDTRTEFEAPYTGIYYWIVRSFNSQEGGYLLKVFDRNQTENLVYLKYADGSERLLDPAKSPPQYGEKEVAILFQFISPIEVINNRTIRYFAKPKEFESGLGLITTPLEVYLKQLTYQDLLQQGSELPENDSNNLVATKLTKLSPSKILIEPEAGGLFPSNRHIVIVEQNIGRYRFFTENPQ